MENLSIEYMPLDSLLPYVKNAKKHPKAQIEELKASIRDFGMNDPIGVWGAENTIVEGHGRLIACRELGIDTVPVIHLDHLSDEERRAYTLAHNKINMDSDFDLDVLTAELMELDMDMEPYGFEIQLQEDEEEEEGWYGDEREKTVNAYNLYDYDPQRTAGRWQMPVLKKTAHMPKDLISFNYVLNTDAFDMGVHFFIDDYQFERLWNDPHKYIERLKQFDCVLTPDFSLYTDMPLAMQLWNVYRSRLIGQICQDNGMKVIPTLQWCRPDSFEFCFDGIEPGGVVAVSTIGVKREASAKEIWFAGMDEAIKRLKPKRVIVYGGDIGYKFTCPATYIENHNAERLKNGR